MSDSETRRRNLAWSVTWLAYASYYLGRKGYSASKSSLKNAGVLDTGALGVIDTAYLGAYSLGQFVSGMLGDRVGARRLVGYGLLLSAGLCAAFGSFSSALLLGLCFTLNGLAQATGWPGTTRAMAEWTTPANRGTVMGWWSTCYQVGPFLAGPLAGMLIVRFGWRSAFWVPALLMALVALLVLRLVREGPRPAQAAELTREAEREQRRLAQRAVVRSPLLWSYAISYFFIKFVRYALMLWLPFYLSQELGYADDKANYVAMAFEGGGMLGVLTMGALSDRLGIGRVGLSALALLGLGLALFGFSRVVGQSTLINVLGLATIGAFLFAPDSILCGAAAQDAGGRHAAAMATGFVNGVGSVGAMVEGLTLPPLAKAYGWSSLFPFLAALALLGALSLAPTLLLKATPPRPT
ncbi:MAG TPA: MFS transporter [Polyangiaceae bacterium]|nr:MFS transporter [Polyangiaceae bacterium]